MSSWSETLTASHHTGNESRSFIKASGPLKPVYLQRDGKHRQLIRTSATLVASIGEIIQTCRKKQKRPFHPDTSKGGRGHVAPGQVSKEKT